VQQVYASLRWPYSDGVFWQAPSTASAEETLLFYPNFIGEDFAITFNMMNIDDARGYGEVTITDITEGQMLYYIQPFWGNYPWVFNYNDWSQSHIYQLQMDVFCEGWDPGDIAWVDLTTDIPFNNIPFLNNIPALPEPATTLLFGLGLVGLAGVRDLIK
jgi:hypothetical protein